jgi:hypothetical protein
MNRINFVLPTMLLLLLVGCAGKQEKVSPGPQKNYAGYGIVSDDKILAFETEALDGEIDGIPVRPAHAIITALDKYIKKKTSRFSNPDQTKTNHYRRPISSYAPIIFNIGFGAEKMKMSYSLLTVSSNEYTKEVLKFVKKHNHPKVVPVSVDCRGLTNFACEKALGEAVLDIVGPEVDLVLQERGY